MSQLNQYLLDSDVLIEYLRNRPQAVEYIDALEGDLLISVITVAELITGTRNQAERESMELFLSALEVVPINYAIARQGGLFRQQYKQSHGTGLDDALIAATAVQSNAQLVTFNRRHFPMIANLQVPYQR
jgi:predicted nucleic acid-binding protein